MVSSTWLIDYDEVLTFELRRGEVTQSSKADRGCDGVVAYTVWGCLTVGGDAETAGV